MPDPSITVKEMNEYGYQWDGMLPLQEEAARRLFENEGVEIYRIYEDNTEGAVLSADEIREHAEQGGLFGVEKVTWQRHLQQPQQEQEAVYLLDDATYLHLQTSEDGYDYTLYDRSLSEIDGGQLDKLCCPINPCTCPAHGIFALINKDENRSLPLRKPRQSVRSQLKDGQTKAAASKKAAAKKNNNDLEV